MDGGTLVVVCAYAGDAEQLEILRPAYEHHRYPILILTPEDSPIEEYHGHKCLQGGKRAYIGQESLDRQHIHMLIAYEQGAEWYLFHDSDSICLSKKIPEYLYQDRTSIYSSEVADHREKGYHDPLPHIAMQPPYWMHRSVLQKFILNGKQPADPVTPFIDWYMVQVAYAAGVEHKPFFNSYCFSSNTPQGAFFAEKVAGEGCVMFHSVKTQDVFDSMMAARQKHDAATDEVV